MENIELGKQNKLADEWLEKANKDAYSPFIISCMSFFLLFFNFTLETKIYIAVACFIVSLWFGLSGYNRTEANKKMYNLLTQKESK